MSPASSDQHSGFVVPGCSLQGHSQSQQSCATTALHPSAGTGPSLDCREQLGGDGSAAEALQEEQQLWEERSQRNGRGKLAHAFSFGRLGPTLGSPTKPPGFISPPVAPNSPAQLLAPTSAAPGPGSPRSVRLTGSVRLIGNHILPPLPVPMAATTPTAAPTAAAPQPQPVSGPFVARMMPFSSPSFGSPGAGLQVLESHLVREPSLRDLLQQRHAQLPPHQPRCYQPLQQVQPPEQPQLPPLKVLPMSSPPSQPEPPLGTSPGTAGMSPPTPDDQPVLASPRKRARKGLPARAAYDDMDLCSPFAQCQVSDNFFD